MTGLSQIGTELLISLVEIYENLLIKFRLTLNSNIIQSISLMRQQILQSSYKLLIISLNKLKTTKNYVLTNESWMNWFQTQAISNQSSHPGAFIADLFQVS